MADRTKTIGVRVTPDEYEKFDECVEESNEFDSLSRFFRLLAHRHIAEEDEDDEVSIDTEDIVTAVNTAQSPIVERLDQLEKHLAAVESNVSDDEDLDELARDLYVSLPTHQDPTELPDLLTLDPAEIQNSNDLRVVQSISTPYYWAQYFEVSLPDIRRAAARMLEYYPDAKFVEEEIERGETGMSIHGDLGVNQDPSQTTDSSKDVNFTVDHETGIRYSGNRIGEKSEEKESVSGPSVGTVRRYYKTEEA